MGWRTTTTRQPSLPSTPATARLVCDLPLPVRTAHTATTGFEDGSMVLAGEAREKPAPAASARRGQVHHLLVRDVRVGEDHLVHAVAADEPGQLLFRVDGDPLGVQRAGQLGG